MCGAFFVSIQHLFLPPFLTRFPFSSEVTILRNDTKTKIGTTRVWGIILSMIFALFSSSPTPPPLYILSRGLEREKKDRKQICEKPPRTSRLFLTVVA